MQVRFAKILGLLVGIFIVGCNVGFTKDDCDDKLGAIVKRTLTLDSFYVVKPEVINVTVAIGDEQLVVARGHEKVIDAINTTVVDGVWTVTFTGGCYVDYQLDVEVTISRHSINATPLFDLMLFPNLKTDD